MLFITIEDETGVANGILWPDRFEAKRRTVLSAAMVGLKGRLQREGIVIHIIIENVIDYTPLLRGIGDREFPFRAGPGDGATHGGGPDARERTQDRGEIGSSEMRIKSRDFH